MARAAIDRGFTLLEVMVALGVFSIGFVGVLALQLAVANNTRVANDISLASNLAADRIELYRVSRYADQVIPETRYYDRLGRELASDGASRHFLLTTTVDFENPPPDEFKDVTVRVNWSYLFSKDPTSGALMQHGVQLKTRILK